MNQLMSETDGILHEMPSVLKLRFERLAREAMLASPPTPNAGIGTLQEKRMHALIKHFLTEDETNHEIRVKPTVDVDEHAEKPKGVGRMVADVLIGQHIYEVQTGSFYPLKPKIHFYLWQTDYEITVVCPIASTKWISWIQPQTGEIGKRSKSPKKGTIFDALKELYWLKEDLGNAKLSICMLFLEVEEFRLQNGWDKTGKRGSERYERVPTSLCDIRLLEKPHDYACFLPDSLPPIFSATDYAKATPLRGRDVYGALQTLSLVGLIRKVEKEGRAQYYERCSIDEY